MGWGQASERNFHNVPGRFVSRIPFITSPGVSIAVYFPQRPHATGCIMERTRKNHRASVLAGKKDSLSLEITALLNEITDILELFELLQITSYNAKVRQNLRSVSLTFDKRTEHKSTKRAPWSLLGIFIA